MELQSFSVTFLSLFFSFVNLKSPSPVSSLLLSLVLLYKRPSAYFIYAIKHRTTTSCNCLPYHHGSVDGACPNTKYSTVRFVKNAIFNKRSNPIITTNGITSNVPGDNGVVVSLVIRGFWFFLESSSSTPVVLRFLLFDFASQRVRCCLIVIRDDATVGGEDEEDVSCCDNNPDDVYDDGE